MRRAVGAGGVGRGPHRRPTPGWGRSWSRLRPADAGLRSRGPPPRRVVRTPRSSPWRPAGGPGRGARPCTRPSSPAPTTVAPRRAPRPSWPPGVAAGGGGRRRPRPPGRRAGGRRPAGGGRRGRVGVGADEVGRAAGPVPEAPAHRAALGRAQAGRHPGRPDRRARRHEPVDHRARRPAPTPTGCGRCPTPCWSGRGPSGPTTPS